jgi:uncharacterized membrane protein
MTSTSRLAARPATTARDPRHQWGVAAGLVLLSAIPLTAGALRVVQLAGGPEIFPRDDRFDAVPVALLVHIVGSAFYALVGVLQLVPGFRRRHWAFHRRAGRVLSVAATLVAGSGLWMTLTYAAQPVTGDILYVARLAVGSAMIGTLVLGLIAIRRHDVAAHRAWMIRTYALGLGAGTQVLTEGLGQAIFGTGVLAGDLEKVAGWVINLAVAEWVIRRPTRSH